MRAVLASHNKKKMKEMREILAQLGVEVISQAEAGVDIEPEETGTTFEENARIKARAIMEATGLPAIADDSGLPVRLRHLLRPARRRRGHEPGHRGGTGGLWSGGGRRLRLRPHLLPAGAGLHHGLPPGGGEKRHIPQRQRPAGISGRMGEKIWN